MVDKSKKMGYYFWPSKNTIKNDHKFKFSGRNLVAKATHCGSSDTSERASQNRSTKVYAIRPMTIQALKGVIRRCISEIPSQLCQAVNEFLQKNSSVPAKPRWTFTWSVVPYVHNSHMSTLWFIQNFYIFSKNTPDLFKIQNNPLLFGRTIVAL